MTTTPIWMHDALTILTPIQGTYLAFIGMIAFGVVIASKTPLVRGVALGVYALGAYGFANVIFRFLA